MRQVKSHVWIAIIVAFFTVTLAQAAAQQGRGQGQNRNGGQGGRGGEESAANGRNFGTNESAPSVPPPPGWKTCPRCQNNLDRAKAAKEYDFDHHPFNPKDLTGMWGWDGIANAFSARNMPPMTDWGKKMREATFGEKGPDGTPLHSKDTSGRGAGSSINCDPYGWPRLHTYNYGFEFVQLPDRLIQFFELNHTWRTIWTDGRKLPQDPPEPRWLGWNVGPWEGDPLVVESNGYDERSWLNQAPPDGGYIHSDQMTVVERIKRPTYGKLEWDITVTDPKAYTQPWVATKGTIQLVPDTELWEGFCVPSDYQQFNDDVFRRAAGAKKK